MKRLVYTFCILSALVLAACSNQWREADAGLTADEMMELLSEAEQPGAFSDANVAEALKFRDDPDASIYFADAPSPLGTVYSVFSISSYLDFLGAGTGWTVDDITEVRLFFFDQPFNGEAALIIALKNSSSDQFQYFGFKGTSGMAGGQYVARLKGADGKSLTLRSHDVEGDDLAPVIQLKVFDANDYLIGQFSTLVGFGP